MAELLSGNEAFARGAYEAGVTVAAGYPGTPSTEILENVAQYTDIYSEWAPNEKVALEVVAGASLTGARAMATMKHVGLNVAADPFMTLSYTGTVGGLIIVVADDPGMHSSQNEQDTRNYARFAKVPLLEPSDSQEAKDFIAYGLSLSEAHSTPVLIRSTTRISHSRSLVSFQDRSVPEGAVSFEKDAPRFVAIPLYARQMRVRMQGRTEDLVKAAEESPLNRMEWRDRSLGIITSGVVYQYVRETFPEASVLKLGFGYPFPDRLFREFASGVERLLIVEELDEIVEEHIKAMGISCEGRSIFPGIGELTPEVLHRSFHGIEAPAPTGSTDGLPSRPPVLCAGCPHRGLFTVLNKHKAVVTGDIGCYSLSVLPPLSSLDTILCMGAGISMAHGMQKAGEQRKVVGIVGDSTFFHSGMTGLLDIVYNQGASTIIVVDNRTTAMTGHQEHPGTGTTLMGEPSETASIQKVAEAFGFKHVYTVDPYNLTETSEALDSALSTDEPALVVSTRACPLRDRARVGDTREILAEACKQCKACLRIGCPAIEATDGAPVINEYLCIGCGLCEQVCKFDAIGVKERSPV